MTYPGRILFVEHKHGPAFYDASTDEKLGAAYVAAVRNSRSSYAVEEFDEAYETGRRATEMLAEFENVAPKDLTAADLSRLQGLRAEADAGQLVSRYIDDLRAAIAGDHEAAARIYSEPYEEHRSESDVAHVETLIDATVVKG